MCTATNLLTKIVSEGANIEPTAAMHHHFNNGWCVVYDLQIIDFYFSGFCLDVFTGAGKFVEGLAVFLDGGEDGWVLFELTEEGFEMSCDIIGS